MDRGPPFGGPACALRDWTNANLRLRRLGLVVVRGSEGPASGHVYGH